MEYSATILGNANSSDKQKEVILRVYYELDQIFIQNKFLKQRIEPLTQQYFIPILKENNPMLVYQVYKVLDRFMDTENLSDYLSQNLAEITYGHILTDNMAVKFAAMVFFTKLLSSEQAMNTAKPHFQAILQIYVKML